MRLIDADAFLERMSRTDRFFGVVFDINDAPTVDAVPVVPGRWEYSEQTIDTPSLLRCSICGWWTLDPSVDGAYHYCPNCGAKMDLKVKVYGVSDDLVEIEGSSYWEDEIGCYDKDVRIWFCDGTVIRIRYADGGIWRIDVETQGTEKHRLDVCSGEDEDDYSDCFYTNAEITSHAVIDKED